MEKGERKGNPEKGKETVKLINKNEAKNSSASNENWVRQEEAIFAEP